jgi:Caspase domain/Sel1 repeat
MRARGDLLALIAALICFCALTATSAFAESRIALVIGNGGYRSITALTNPPNDAKDVAAQLTALGFNVTFGVDLEQATMESKINAFAKAAADADVSLFYYGGHGVQVAGRNYLIPVDAQLHNEEDIYQHAIHLDDVVKGLEQGKGVHLIFLDACRNSPINDATGPGASEGLARVGNAAGFLFAFATQPDNVAFDGAGRNSPFAQALLGHVATAGEDVSSMMIEVRKDVIAATGGSQIPWENTSLTRQFYFAPAAATAGSPETMLWQLAGGQHDPNLLNIYLERYPEGAHAADVRALLAEAAKSGTASPIGGPAAKENVEEVLWSLARSGRQRPLLELYLARYPSGVHVQDASTLLASLTEAQAGQPSAGELCARLAMHPRDATANMSGVDLETLTRNAGQAIDACSQAVGEHPGIAHYIALLARAKAADGQLNEAVGLYRKAADAGDARAMVSLGLLLESGDHAPKDIPAAYALYEKAAARGSADGAINLAVALLSGKGIEKDAARAEKLLRSAAQGGSAIATYNLGVLAEEGVAGKPADALDLFKQTAGLGDARGFLAAAILLDEGRGAPKDAGAAADQLLRGVAADAGEASNQLTMKSASWSQDTIKAVQARLRAAGYYSGAIDGKAGPDLGPALKQWRLLGGPQRS